MADQTRKDQKTTSPDDAARKGMNDKQATTGDLEVPKDDADAVRGGLMPRRDQDG